METKCCGTCRYYYSDSAIDGRCGWMRDHPFPFVFAGTNRQLLADPVTLCSHGDTCETYEGRQREGA